jgi:hypothetical protein
VPEEKGCLTVRIPQMRKRCVRQAVVLPLPLTMRRRQPLEPARALYVEDLARRLQSLEHGEQAMDPRAYRLFARRLRSALAGLSQQQLRRFLGIHPAMNEGRANLYFEEHGHFEGMQPVAELANALLAGLRTGPPLRS